MSCRTLFSTYIIGPKVSEKKKLKEREIHHSKVKKKKKKEKYAPPGEREKEVLFEFKSINRLIHVS